MLFLFVTGRFVAWCWRPGDNESFGHGCEKVFARHAQISAGALPITSRTPDDVPVWRCSRQTVPLYNIHSSESVVMCLVLGSVAKLWSVVVV